MKDYDMARAVWGVSVVAMVALACTMPYAPVMAQETGATTALSMPMVDAKVDEAVALAQTGNWNEALTAYTLLVNAPDATQRGQVRYGLAVVLSQLGRDTEALKALEGTSADETELGQAVGTLRGHLVLQLAEKALMETGSTKTYLNDYDRLLHKPNPTRAQRLRAMEDTGTAPAPAALRVGVLLPLSGPLAPVGKNVLRGLQLALTEVEPLRGAMVELVPADTSLGATQALDAALAQGARVVVGPLLGKNVSEIAGRAQAASTPLLSFSNDDDVASRDVHMLPSLPADQARRMARWAVANGHMQVAALAPATPYGARMVEAFKTELEREGGKLVQTVTFSPQDMDFSAKVKALVGDKPLTGAAAFNGLFLPVPAATLPMITSQLAYYNVDRAGVQLIGTGLWHDNALLNASARSVRGGVFASPAQPPAFAQAYASAYGKQPDAMALQGYDAGRLMLQIAADRDWSGRDVMQLLGRNEGFYGVGGYYTFQPNGQTERGLALVRVGDGAFEVLQPALTLAPLAVPANLRPSGLRRGGWW
ncbi:MAG: penicillin-binding protein activator [Alphaproteobacteria bacterium]